MEGLWYLIGVILLLVFSFWFIKTERKRTNEEILRRETIKNCLCDIVEKLDNISNGIWYEK